MDWRTVVTRLFGACHAIAADGEFLGGMAVFEGTALALSLIHI